VLLGLRRLRSGAKRTRAMNKHSRSGGPGKTELSASTPAWILPGTKCDCMCLLWCTGTVCCWLVCVPGGVVQGYGVAKRRRRWNRLALGAARASHCHAMFESLPLKAVVDGSERPVRTVLPSEHLAQCNALHFNVFFVSIPLKAAADVADSHDTKDEDVD